MTDQLRQEFENYWESHRHSPLEGRNKILSAFCPQVFGLYVVKLAVSLVLIGGVQRVKESGTRIRGESHLLLVGDPGALLGVVVKDEVYFLLKFCHELSK